MKRVALIDDENHIAVDLAKTIASSAEGAVEIEALDRPRRLNSIDLSTPFTHAVVDLSYGLWNYDSAENFSPEPDLGIDAIDALLQRDGSTKIVVMTRLDTPLLQEMATAIREFWPEIRFLHKSDLGVLDRAAAFVLKSEVRDNAEVSLLLTGIAPRSENELRAAFSLMPSPSTSARVAQALSSCIDRPMHEQIAAALPYSVKYVRRVVHETASLLRDQDWIPTADQAGIDRLWIWCRARRPLLMRCLDVGG